MADNMMRIAGRGEDGLAKAIKTDNVGNIEIGNVVALKGVGKNLFNKDTVILGRTITAETGVSVLSSGEWYHSDYIPVTPGFKIKFNGLTTSIRGLAFYKNKIFVSGLSNAAIIAQNLTVTIPENVDSMRVTNNSASKSPETFQVEVGDVTTAYEAYKKVDYLKDLLEQSKKAVMAEDINGVAVALSSEIDGSGRHVLRTVDAAPFAYDETDDVLKTRKHTKKTITTIANNVSIIAGATSAQLLLGTDGTESEVWVAVSINKFPWTLRGSNDFGGVWSDAFYPRREGALSDYIVSAPAMSLALGVLMTLQNVGAPTTYNEAKQIAQPLNAASFLTITNNHATDVATFTIKVIRIWR